MPLYYTKNFEDDKDLNDANVIGEKLRIIFSNLKYEVFKGAF